ncbi:hypothetical protein HF521_001795 [Silurus meridionalis]|uniref:Immunoglobulin V-set domain-containing protein n=1 Tax=Silurus meridionalis TaxID=175797 RepID=A0A8T0B7J5_SILME|nr:hypothetical protein HF521_001795 [Silurus meridionalis]
MKFCTICTVWITVCVCLVSADKLIKAEVSSTVILPCTLRVQSKTPYIRWSTDKEDVFERSGEESLQAHGYEGRVSLSAEKLRDGDCSLILSNLTLNDKGVYRSFQAVKRTKRSVEEQWSLLSVIELSVNEPVPKKPVEKTFETSGETRTNYPHAQGAVEVPVEVPDKICGCSPESMRVSPGKTVAGITMNGLVSADKLIKADVSSSVFLPCTLRVQSKTPYIKWSTDEEVLFERSGEEFYEGQGFEGRVKVSAEKLRDGDCSLILSNLTLNDKGLQVFMILADYSRDVLCLPLVAEDAA